MKNIKKALILGASGILVLPEDPDIVEQALRISFIDDDLVNKAAEQNYAVIKEKLDCYELKNKALKIHEFVKNR